MTQNLKLGKLPDRKPVKYTVTVSAEIAGLLEDYAAIYNQAYGGEAEPVEELIPYMLEMFLRSDRVFLKARQGLPASDAD
ncbi:DUF2274 domain-containing protein [Kordiimonas sp.]|uniref:DUF2274 domain-containing protein n=1 Tax=Kordiimonas sp. TaxID=1970157 RepID=UPI003A942DA1